LIAGAAAGGAAVVGLIGLGWFCIVRRRSKRAAPAAPAAPAAKQEESIAMNKPAEQYYPPMYTPHATEMQHFDRSELDGPEKRAELGHYGQHGPYGQYGHSISEMSSHNEHQIVELEGSGPLHR
jgi:hypothetical protein